MTKFAYIKPMSGGIYQVIVIIVGAFALLKGFRKGFTGQVCSILGLVMGVLCSFIFCRPVGEWLQQNLGVMTSYPFPSFLYSVFASALIYTGVFTVFKIFTRVLRRAMEIFRIGMLDRLCGAAFSLLKYLLALSIIYNIILCINPDSPLVEYSKADDGNLVEGVLMLGPALLGCLSVEDLSHALQLIDAKKISFNFNEGKDVITKERNKILTC